MSTCQWHCIKSRGNNQVFNQLAWSIDQKSNIQVFINSYDIVYFISGPGENLVRGWVTYFSWRWSWRCLWVCIWESKGGGKGTTVQELGWLNITAGDGGQTWLVPNGSCVSYLHGQKKVLMLQQIVLDWIFVLWIATSLV